MKRTIGWVLALWMALALMSAAMAAGELPLYCRGNSTISSDAEQNRGYTFTTDAAGNDSLDGSWTVTTEGPIGTVSWNGGSFLWSTKGVAPGSKGRIVAEKNGVRHAMDAEVTLPFLGLYTTPTADLSSYLGTIRGVTVDYARTGRSIFLCRSAEGSFFNFTSVENVSGCTAILLNDESVQIMLLPTASGTVSASFTLKTDRSGSYLSSNDVSITFIDGHGGAVGTVLHVVGADHDDARVVVNSSAMIKLAHDKGVLLDGTYSYSLSDPAMGSVRWDGSAAALCWDATGVKPGQTGTIIASKDGVDYQAAARIYYPDFGFFSTPQATPDSFIAWRPVIEYLKTGRTVYIVGSPDHGFVLDSVATGGRDLNCRITGSGVYGDNAIEVTYGGSGSLAASISFSWTLGSGDSGKSNILALFTDGRALLTSNGIFTASVRSGANTSLSLRTVDGQAVDGTFLPLNNDPRLGSLLWNGREWTADGAEAVPGASGVMQFEKDGDVYDLAVSVEWPAFWWAAGPYWNSAYIGPVGTEPVVDLGKGSGAAYLLTGPSLAQYAFTKAESDDDVTLEMGADCIKVTPNRSAAISATITYELSDGSAGTALIAFAPAPTVRADAPSPAIKNDKGETVRLVTLRTPAENLSTVLALAAAYDETGRFVGMSTIELLPGDLYIFEVPCENGARLRLFGLYTDGTLIPAQQPEEFKLD